MTDYLTVIEILAIHEDQIERYGGDGGIRDMGLLEAALYRPQTGYYEDIVEEAAALWESLTRNHPFVDGNKRTGFAAAHVFLMVNGVALTAGPEETHGFIAGALESGTITFERLVEWLRENTEA